VFADYAQRVGLANSSDHLRQANAPASGPATPVTAVCAEAALTKGPARQALSVGAFGTDHIA